MPNIENLKKQAKLILRWHRERHYPVAAQIRADLPRFRHLSDPEVLAASFKLSDAQEMVARQNGFESWQALKTGVSSMQEKAERTTPRAVLTAAYPQLFVADIKASCDFYTAKLGFKITILYGEPPFYAHVARDGATLILHCVDRPVIDAAYRESEGLLSAECGVNTAEEIKSLFLEFQAAGVTFFQTLKLMPWGARNFIVKDPDGNLVLFAGPGS
jgi:catechol 2,3-dioxygenase-like lactoylglutathione lyase family enzyme